MQKTVLIVDDDEIWLHAIKKKMDKYKKAFSVLTAEDGLDAVEKLKKNVISLVVTDIQMPRMDGLALLAHLSENYPDIPVIVVTAYSTPKSKKAVLERGAAGYIEKPFAIEDLIQKIANSLKRESEGGILQTIPLEMFIQLIEMEQKTCTIRVVNKSSNKHGVLFFKNGILLDARVADLQGKLASYEIFSWDKVTMFVQDSCALKEKRIEEDLQAILLDAMRLKDEADEDEEPALETAEAISPKEDLHKTEIQDATSEDAVRNRLKQIIGEKNLLKEISHDNSWDDLITQAARIGKIFESGDLKSCYVDNGKLIDLILLPGNKTTVIPINPQCPRDRILQALSE